MLYEKMPREDLFFVGFAYSLLLNSRLRGGKPGANALVK
jgi:hypothetical protein